MAEIPTNKIDGMELSSVGPGHRLRDARKLSNLDQSDIATQLNLDIATINALEKDDYARMPPAVFVRGYLRAYAGMVGLSVDDILSSFDAMQGIDPSERNYRAATRITATGAPKPRSNVVPVALVLVVLIAAIAGGAYWWWQQQSARTSSQVATESSAKPAVVEEPVIPMEMDSQQQVAPAEPVAMPEPVIGTAEAMFVNLPTRPYDYDAPDKRRLPADTDAIPFRFRGASPRSG